jgi:hypothetical protein
MRQRGYIKMSNKGNRAWCRIFTRSWNSPALEGSKGKRTITSPHTTPTNPPPSTTQSMPPTCHPMKVAFADSFNNSRTLMLRETPTKSPLISSTTSRPRFSLTCRWASKTQMPAHSAISPMILPSIQLKALFSTCPCNWTRLKPKTYAAFSPKKAPFCIKASNSSLLSSTQCNKTICTLLLEICVWLTSARLTCWMCSWSFMGRKGKMFKLRPTRSFSKDSNTIRTFSLKSDLTRRASRTMALMCRFVTRPTQLPRKRSTLRRCCP